jgi:hypothetical protein
VKILDTNLWVFGTLRTNAQAVELLAEIDRGETTSAINAYMLHEALAAFDRTQSLSSADRRQNQLPDSTHADDGPHRGAVESRCE